MGLKVPSTVVATTLFLVLLHILIGYIGAVDEKSSAAASTSRRRKLNAADPHDVQPHARDEVHAVWVNGPTQKAQLGGHRPSLSSNPGSNNYVVGHTCQANREYFTGYNDNGGYCQASDNQFDENPHLIMHSGRVGVVLDASAGKLFRQIGAVDSLSSSKDVYNSLDESSSVDVSLALTCPNLEPVDLQLGVPTSGPNAEFGLVRQGHAVTHVTIEEGLKWIDVDGTGEEAWGIPTPECSVIAETDPVGSNCNQDFGGASFPCPNADYPVCLDFVQGKRWGKCWQDVPSCDFQAPWMEVLVWADAIVLKVHWSNEPTDLSGCSGTVQLQVVQLAGSPQEMRITKTVPLESQNSLALTLSSTSDTGVLQEEVRVSSGLDSDVSVASAEGTPLARDDFQDFIVEVPTNLAKCSYTVCNSQGEVDVVVTNAHPTEERTVRLTLSRNFPLQSQAIVPQSRTGAEITGLNVVVMDSTGTVPVGIPSHISKNWHTGVGSSIYAGYWWTSNVFLRLPPGSSLDMKFVVLYEQYGDIPAFSHAQLSIVGYSNKWLWEEAALGTGGENYCMDPYGSHTRASVTDVRVKLFDGKWKENVGGADFLLYFDEQGSMQYPVQLDAQLHTNGPCLSNATYTSVSVDGAIQSKVQVSGGRTDDMVRMFIDLSYQVTSDTSFSRLAFFQMGSETYNYNAAFEQFVFGAGSEKTHDFARTCTGGTSRSRHKLYDETENGIYREFLAENADGPWWFAMGQNAGQSYTGTNTMVVGDRGLIIREYHARLGGLQVQSPSVSVLCDKLELGPPREVSMLKAGDFVNIKLEMVVLPRQGTDFDQALANSPSSRTLQTLDALSGTWQRVQAHAVNHIQVTNALPVGTRVESHSPIRVCVPEGADSVVFTVTGTALGFVPVVICDLSSSAVPDGGGLWTGNDDFTLLTDETLHRQANYDRISQKYELVFNLEIQNIEGTSTLGFGSAESLRALLKPPTSEPTTPPVDSPSSTPSVAPTISPSTSPVEAPSLTPSITPTTSPSASPIVLSSSTPSETPTKSPSTSPIGSPSASPSASPSDAPSLPSCASNARTMVRWLDGDTGGTRRQIRCNSLVDTFGSQVCSFTARRRSYRPFRNNRKVRDICQLECVLHESSDASICDPSLPPTCDHRPNRTIRFSIDGRPVTIKCKDLAAPAWLDKGVCDLSFLNRKFKPKKNKYIRNKCQAQCVNHTRMYLNCTPP